MTVGLFLLLLLVFWPAYPAAAQRETPFQKFQRQHVDTAPMWEADSTRYCNQMMPQRNMTTGTCKELNSFVHGQLKEIVNVCDGGGTWHHGNFYYSNSPFNVTDCNLTGTPTPPSCVYRGQMTEKRICVACTNKQPVHYAKPSVCGGPKTKGEVC